MTSSSEPIPLVVHLLSSHCDPAALRGGVAVVIDILRASTTMTTALLNGAASVVPCLTVDDARSLQQQSRSGTVLLGGERGGVRIDGFELSNSPADYTRDTIGGRTVGFTTTNGTKTLLQSGEAELIVVGAFVNLDAVVRFLQVMRLPAHLMCAGTDGFITGEDVLFAGAVVHELTRTHSKAKWQPDDAAVIAGSYWVQEVLNNAAEQTSAAGQTPLPPNKTQIARSLEQALRETRGGRNLQNLGYSADIALCSQIDAAPVLPVYCKKRGILLAEQVSG